MDSLPKEINTINERLALLERLERPRTRYHGRIFRNALGVQAINNLTVTAIAFDSTLEDTTGMFVPVGGPPASDNKITCNLAGWYSLGGTARFDANATGYRNLRIRVNGTNIVIQEVQAVTVAAEGTILNVHTEYKLAVGDVVELMVQQNSGAPLNVSVAGLNPALWWTRLV